MKIYILLFAGIFLCALPVHASTLVTGGDAAKNLYATEKANAQILVQKGKVFILRVHGSETPAPSDLKVKTRERFFIANEEMEYVHNVYDEDDQTWVLKKQEPAGVAAIAFDKPGIHHLRCAIHPQMKIKVTVE